MKPISKEERQAWGLELTAVARRPAFTKSADSVGAVVERDFSALLVGLDSTELRLLVQECLRRLMTGKPKDGRAHLVGWVSSMARSLVMADAGGASRWELKALPPSKKRRGPRR